MLPSLTEFCEPNISGAFTIEYQDVRNMQLNDYIRWNDTGEINYEITFTSGTWLKMPMASSESDIREDQNENKHGHYWRSRIDGHVVGKSAVLQNELDRLTYYRFIVKVTLADGQQYIYGSYKHPMRFTVDSSTGSLGGSRRGYKCRFYADIPWKARLYNPLY